MNRALLLVVTLLAWAVPCATAQEQKAASKLYARLQGEELLVAIEVKVERDWHLYHGPAETDIGTEGAVGKPTTVEFDAHGFEIGALVYPEPKRVPQEIGELRYTAFEHKGTFALFARGRRSSPDAQLADLGATISGLTCVDSGTCIPYDEELPYAGTGPDALFAKFPAAAIAPPAGAGEQEPASSSAAAGDQKAAARLFAREKDKVVEVAIEVKLGPGWHLYHGPTEKDKGSEGSSGLPTTVEFTTKEFVFDPVVYPRPVKATETVDKETYTVYEHKDTFVLRARGRRVDNLGKLEELRATIAGLACQDDGVCVPYEEELAYAGAGADAMFAATVGPAKVAEPQKREDFALWAFLLSAVGWGLFTLLMPCTYPMIPITISYFTKQASQRQSSTLPLSLAYGVGIIGTFVLIGLIVGPPIVVFASHPVTNLVIGLLFLYFSLTLFGAVNLQPPAFLLNVAGQASSKGGLAGVFLMGATLVVTSFTCTAPFVGTLLSTGASSGGLGRVALGMAVFGATMAVPFVALSMLPGKAKSIPRSGEWMHTLKVTLGFVEIAAALKFISNVDIIWEWGWLSRELFLALWVAIFAAAALYLFGMIKLKDEATSEISPARMVTGLVFLVLTLYCGYGALGNKMDSIMTAIIPPYSNSISDARGGKTRSKETWPIVIDDYETALAQAKQEQKVLLVNFTGHT